MRPDLERRLFHYQVGSFIRDGDARAELVPQLFEQFRASRPAFWRHTSGMLGQVVSRRFKARQLQHFHRPVRIIFGVSDSLGVARNVLTDRLERLVEAGVLERVEYQQRPPRFKYRLTAVGLELCTPVVGLMHWGDRHRSGPDGLPRLTRHRECGGQLHAELVCGQWGETVSGTELELPGPGLRTAPLAAG
ncbi:winged helix-turn-helix transcriptional regulator [Rhodococcus oxybenzonivorans]|nr:helix-turn-helix domain-containing protein [Rhodococcus oxybenzonivorans]